MPRPAWESEAVDMLHTPGRWLRRHAPSLLAVLAACLLVKLALYALAPDPLFASDSRAYVNRAVDMRPLWGRPLGYSWFLHAAWRAAGRRWSDALPLVVFLQTLVGALTGVTVYLTARHYLHAARPAAWASALVVSLSPLGLLLDRHVLSDGLALFLMAVSLALYFAMVRTMSRLAAAVLGGFLLLPMVVRSCWVFLPPFFIVHCILQTVAIRRARVKRVVQLVAVLCVCFAALYVPYVRHYTRRLTGRPQPMAGTSAFTGMLLWFRVHDLARPETLDGEEGGDFLLSDAGQLTIDKLWDPASGPNRYKAEVCAGDPVEASRRLSRLAVRVALRHPGAVLSRVMRTALRYMLPVGGKINHARDHFVLVGQSGDALRFEREPTDAKARRTSSRVEALYALWLWTRPLFALFLAAGLVYAVRSFRQRYGVLVVGTLGVCYLFMISLAIGVTVDRYVLPIEYLGMLSLAGATRRRQRCRKKDAAD